MKTSLLCLLLFCFSFTHTQTDLSWRDASLSSKKINGLNFNAKIRYTPDCAHTTPFVRATLHSVEVTSFEYNGKQYSGNDIPGYQFPIKISKGYLSVSTNLVGFANNFDLKLKKSHLSMSNTGEGNEFMADEFRFENESEAIKTLKSKLSISGCKDIKLSFEYMQATLGGKKWDFGKFTVHDGDLRYKGQGLHSLLIIAIKKMEKEKKTTKTKDFLADDKSTSTKSSSSKDFLANPSSTKSKSSSSKDFLASGSSSKKTSTKSNDFLASGSSKNKSNDILSEKKDSKSDFLDDKTNSSDYKIDYKDGKVGVISKSGKVLIPYKEWQILTYHNGIAKVSIPLETKKCHCYLQRYYYGYANKIGYVDKSGNFIDGFEVDVTIDDGSQPAYIKLVKTDKNGNTITKTGPSAKAIEQKKKREKCEEELNSWKTQMKSKY